MKDISCSIHTLSDFYQYCHVVYLTIVDLIELNDQIAGNARKDELIRISSNKQSFVVWVNLLAQWLQFVTSEWYFMLLLAMKTYLVVVWMKWRISQIGGIHCQLPFS